MGPHVSRIRNFAIISHVDHGKSTLADRFLELTGTVEARKMHPQYLDQMDLEQERGITIKMQPVRMLWHPKVPSSKDQIPNKFQNSNSSNSERLELGALNLALANLAQEFVLNLIDTPGHADFSYEVSRALAAVEGAILLVDATQGVQAQTLAVLHVAQEEDLCIIPVINKIDLAGAMIHEAVEELVAVVGCAPGDVLKISAKTGEGVREVLEAIIERIPPPDEGRHPRSRALIFDSHFNAFRGVIAHVRVFDGAFSRGDAVRTCATRAAAEILELGYFTPALKEAERLAAGAIGYIATGLKEPDAIRVGDTITEFKYLNIEISKVEPLPGYREPTPMVFASIYPEDADEYERLLDALKKIKLNDAALSFEPEASDALGRGFRAGFLGMLHMEIVGERLKREYGLRMIVTTPSVAYRVAHPDGREGFVYSAARFPDLRDGIIAKEPWVRLDVVTPPKFLGNVMRLLVHTRGKYVRQDSVGLERLTIVYEVPLKDILTDFFDRLKSVSEGYASFGYELLEYRRGDLVRLDILVAGEREEALSQVVPSERAYHEGRAVAEKLKTLLPKQLFPVSIQACLGGRVIARETIPALRKDVTGYLYGGDRTRKMKLWKKQKRGKKRLEAEGRIEIPPHVYLELMNPVTTRPKGRGTR